MHGLALLLAAASVGVDYGWQPTANGEVEYIIQIEPELIASLRKGEAIISEIHPDVSGVRRFRIQIGSEPLPRIAKPAAESSSKSSLPESVSSDPNPQAAFPSLRRESKRDSTFQLTDDTDPNPQEQPPVLSFPAEVGPLQPADELKPLSPPRPLPGTRVSEAADSLTTQSPTPIPDPDAATNPSNALPLSASKSRPHDKASTGTSSTPFPGAQQAVYHEKTPLPTKKAGLAKPNSPKLDSSTPPRPWLLFSLTILGLLTSLGANAYLGYLLLGIKRRYQDLRQDQVYGTS